MLSQQESMGDYCTVASLEEIQGTPKQRPTKQPEKKQNGPFAGMQTAYWMLCVIDVYDTTY